jgi:Winged helix-turn helix
MSERHKLELNESQRAELEWMRDHDALPHHRERAAALLKIADGQSAHAVARSGLYKRRDPDTVYSWLKRYRAEGIAGLRIRTGRGRKAAFSPSLSYVRASA